MEEEEARDRWKKEWHRFINHLAEEKTAEDFLRSCHAERSIVPREPRVPQFGDEGIQEELVLSSQSIAVLHLLRIAELAKERVEYRETLFDRHRFFYR
jgi:hypothetical protein